MEGETPEKKGQLIVSVGLVVHHEVDGAIRKYFSLLKLTAYYARCFGWSIWPGRKLGVVTFPELEGAQLPSTGYRTVAQIAEEMNSSTWRPGLVVINNAERFCVQKAGATSELLALTVVLRDMGINVVITGKPTPEMFLLMSYADIPIRAQTPTCQTQHPTGLCGHPANSWVWYNSSGIVPIYEFLRILLLPISWVVNLDEELRKYAKTHYPQAIAKPNPFYPGWMLALLVLLFGPIELQGRCPAHEKMGDDDEPIQLGKLTLITGSVDAAKSLYLANAVREHTHGEMGADPTVAMFSISTRGSRSKLIPGYEPIPIRDPNEICIMEGVHIVTIDEAWCLGDDNLQEALIKLKGQGITCYVATYQTSGDGHPFGNTALLMCLADEVVTLQGRCYVCGRNTSLTQVVYQEVHEGDWYLLPDEDFGPDHVVLPSAFATRHKIDFRPACRVHYKTPSTGGPDEDIESLSQFVDDSEPPKNSVALIRNEVKPSDAKKYAARVFAILGANVLTGILLADVLTNPMRYVYPGLVFCVLFMTYFWWRFGMVIENNKKRRMFVTVMTLCSLVMPTILALEVYNLSTLTPQERYELWQYVAKVVDRYFWNGPWLPATYELAAILFMVGVMFNLIGRVAKRKVKRK